MTPSTPISVSQSGFGLSVPAGSGVRGGGALIESPQGYDGQFFYVQALDPLLLRASTLGALRVARQSFRLQRTAYPALAFLMAGGQARAIPFTLVAVNVFVLLTFAAAFAVYARRRGWSSLWAPAIVLMPGMLLPSLRDLSDPLATACMLCGILQWQSGRRWPAALALTVAVLAREMMIVAVVAVTADAVVRAWRARDVPRAGRAIAGRVWPVLVIPAMAFVAWQAYVTARCGGPVGGPEISGPVINMIREIRSSAATGLPLYAAWDAVYVLLIAAAVVAAFVSLRRRVTLIGIAACAAAIGVLLPTFGDVWSDTRLSAPLFGLLLVDGLQRRDRGSVVIAAAAASMTILVPFAIPGPF